MISLCNTTVQTMPTYSKKVTDMILYAVAKEIAKKLLSSEADEYQKAGILMNRRKNARTTKRKKMLPAKSVSC